MSITTTAPGLLAGEPRPGQHEPPMAIPYTENGHTSDDDSIFDDQDEDGAQAAMQPAISAVASHLTSKQTPAIEKAAALEKAPTGGYFDGVVEDPEGGSGGDGESTPESGSPDVKPVRKPSVAMPSPWISGPKELVITEPSGQRQRASKGFFESAFGPTRMRRSGSAGQEALKKLQRAFPSLSPSLQSSFFSSPFSDKTPQGGSPGSDNSSSATLGKRSAPAPSTRNVPPGEETTTTKPKPSRAGSGAVAAHSAAKRPPVLRRVTSDESILYHSLSRASSLGDDDRFQDVREMVNMRLMAIKDSLPDVPNFKMPNLTKIGSSSWMSPLGIHNPPTNEGLHPPRPQVDRQTSSTSRDGLTALDDVLEYMEGDLVILGGYRGSVLRSAEPPHQQLWAPVKLGLNMRKANLEVGLEDDDEHSMESTIIPSGMLKHIGPIDITRRLFKKLRSCENARTGKLRVWDYGYDWRLSPRLSSLKLRQFLEKLPSNAPGVAPESRGALVVAHSLGGLITRHAVNQQPELFSGVLYAGTPQRCINILGPMRNGDAVLLNEKLLTAQVNFSIRTSFVFLPEDGFCFVDKETGEEYPVDFYDPQQWVKWRLSPCVAPPLPPLRQSSSALSSLLPNPLRSRGNSRAAEKPRVSELQQNAALASHPKDRTLGTAAAPQMGSQTTTSGPTTADAEPPSDPERKRYLEYLTRTLAATRKFRSELAHSEVHQSRNAYPPLAVLYGKAIPTVYAAQVQGREGIPCADAYDDLLFRSGDGVVLARESMLPEGYHMVRGGRVSTERGHITMLGDMPAMGRAFEALLRGRRKGIGLGNGGEEEELKA